MKKKFTSMVGVLLTGTLLLAACGESDNNENAGNDGGNNDNTEENGENENNNSGESSSDGSNLQLGTGSTGGTYYPLGQEMATILEDNVDVDDFGVSAVSSGASVDNISMIYQGEMDLGMSVHLPALDSLTGDGDFEGVEVDNFGFMGHLYPEVMQIVTGDDSDIESIEDLEGASVAIGPPGSGTQSAAKLLLEAYGLEEGDYEAYEEGFGDAAGRIQDGNLDASFALLGLPAGGIEELSVQRDIRMIPVGDKGLEYVEENSGYEAMTIPADSYDFMDEDVETITAYAVLLGSLDSVDEDLGYEITKNLFENSEDISHPQAEHITDENALDGSDGLPMHPGSEKYFEEEGLLE